MNRIGLNEEADLSANAFLSSKISFALRRAENKESLDSVDLSALKRGVEFMETIISGSLLDATESGDSVQGISPSAKGLSAFTIAMRAIQPSLKGGDAESKLVPYFLECRENLKKLSSGQSVVKRDLNRTRSFFETLTKKLDAERTRNRFVPDAFEQAAL